MSSKAMLLMVVVLMSWSSYSVTVHAHLVTLSHGGVVEGTVQYGFYNGNSVPVRTFLGIPFAKPPVGDLRFAKPVQHPGWTGKRDATKLPPTCWQFLPTEFDLNNKGAKMWLNNTEMSEDCLYLNVWQPEHMVGDEKPVMVWIYGGGLTTGTSTLDVYNGRLLAAEHDVVVVSMQYRLGAFGFLNLERGNRPSDEYRHAVGNMGLWDQLLALEWVKREIRRFDGDPYRVTLFGESSGAVSVSSQWISPKTKGLFQRVILQSGNVLARWGIQDQKVSHRNSEVFTEHCNCSTKHGHKDRNSKITCLQKLKPLDLVNCLSSIYDAVAADRNETMWNNFFKDMPGKYGINGSYPGLATGSYYYFDVPLSVVVDNDFFPEHPAELIKKPTNTPDLLIGVNQDEAIYFLLYGLGVKNARFLYDNGYIALPDSIIKSARRQPLEQGGEVADFHWITALQILEQKYLRQGLTNPPVQFYGLPEGLNSSFYFANPNETQILGMELMKRINNLASDMDFVCPTLDFADRVARLPKANVYMYYFTQPTSQLPWPRWTGVMHGYEIHYVFGMQHSKEFQEQFFGFTAKETKFGDEMQQFWVNFAKTANPNKRADFSPDSGFWPRYKPAKDKSANEKDYLILNYNMRSASGLRDQECAFWLHLMENQREIVEKLSKKK